MFSCMFWLVLEGKLVGALPATLLNENCSKFGFASIPEHTLSRMATPLNQ